MAVDYDAVKRLVVDIVGDSNHIYRQDGIKALLASDREEVVAALIEVLLDKGRGIRYWDDVVEGVCRFLLVADASLSVSCAAALLDVLAGCGNAKSPDPTFMLDVMMEKLDARDLPFAIPFLVDLVRLRSGDEVGRAALQLLERFPPDLLRPYRRILDDLPSGSREH